MSARYVTKKQLLEMLEPFPDDMFVVSFGIESLSKGERLDGVSVYTFPCIDHGDGFVPLNPDKMAGDVDEYKDMIVIAPIEKDGLLEWCFDDDV